MRLVSQVTASTEAEILAPGLGRNSNPRRRLLIWSLRRYAGLKHIQIGGITGMSPVAVAQTLARIRNMNEASPSLRTWMNLVDSLMKNVKR